MGDTGDKLTLVFGMRSRTRNPDFSGYVSQMVEAAGQLFHLFRDGLDYAFIRSA